MKVLSLLLLAAAVSARPEPAPTNQELKDSASLPLVVRRRQLEREGGAEIPVQLVYEEEGERRSAVCGGRRQRRSIGGQHTAASGGHQGTGGGGPSIVKLKVRRGGVAIAGPGGVATAGSGGTAIVGPGGTAFTTPDGTAVVGPGGRLIHLSPYVTKGRSAAPRLIATGPVIYYPLQF